MSYVTMKRKGCNDIECLRNKMSLSGDRGLLYIRNIRVLRRGESVVKKSNIQVMTPTGAMHKALVLVVQERNVRIQEGMRP